MNEFKQVEERFPDDQMTNLIKDRLKGNNISLRLY